MNLQAFISVKFVEENGYLTNEMQLFIDNLIQTLMGGLSNDGWTLPQLTAAEIATIQIEMPDGTMWYDLDSHEIVCKVNGALRKITTTAYP